MKISVIVPVLNGERHLDQSLHSIAQQQIPAELIVIDGGSTDGSLATLKNYKSRITYFESGCDSGIADAFNRGIAHASGDYLAILNSDDYWEPDTLARVLEAARGLSVPSIILGWCRIHAEGASSFIKKPNLDAMKRYMSLTHCTLFVHRKIYKQIGCYDTSYRLAMDSEWTHRALAQGVPFREIPEVLCNMRMGGISDRNGIAALREYRRSVIHHGLANPAYAHTFFLLHSAAKLAYRIPAVYRLKTLYDRYFNTTVANS